MIFIFIDDRMKSVPNLNKMTQNDYETIFYYALNPNFDYTCIYISVLLHQYVL